MNLRYILIILGIFATSACSKKDPASTDMQQPFQTEKSAKRGLAYNLTDSTDLSALKEGVSWWYNWYFRTDAEDGYYDNFQMEFLPMLWGGNTSNVDVALVKDFIMKHEEIEYLLVMNEPNLTDQANRTPAQAARDWKIYEEVISSLAAQGRTIRLVGPAITWGTQTGYSDPVVWMDAFYEAYRQANDGKDPLIDYLAFHWYDYGLAEQLDRLKKYGKQIWVTEMANWNPQINSYVKQMAQMQSMVNICESRDDVFRYAWFIGRGFENKYTNLFNEGSGELNDLGTLYLNLPYAK